MRKQVEAAVEYERAGLSTKNELGRIPSKEIVEALNSDEDGDAKLFIKLFRDLFCFDHAAGEWYAWNGHCWALDMVGEASKAISYLVELYSTESENQERLISKARDERRTEDAREHSLAKVNPFEYLTALQVHASQFRKNPKDWMPWNYEKTA